MLEQELQFEKDLFFLLNGSDSIFFDYFFWLYSYKWTWIPFYVCFVIIFIYKKNWKEFILTLLSVALVILLCDQIASSFFKPIFQRFRPTHHPDFHDQVQIVLGYKGGMYGFISSHAANSFGFATLMAFIFRNRLFTCMIMIFSLINGYSRIYLGVHFISDVVVGSLVGIIIGYMVYKLYHISRIYILKTEEKELNKPMYTQQQVYFLCLMFIITLLALVVFDNQLVNYFKH